MGLLDQDDHQQGSTTSGLLHADQRQDSFLFPDFNSSFAPPPRPPEQPQEERPQRPSSQQTENMQSSSMLSVRSATTSQSSTSSDQSDFPELCRTEAHPSRSRRSTTPPATDQPSSLRPRPNRPRRKSTLKTRPKRSESFDLFGKDEELQAAEPRINFCDICMKPCDVH